MVFDEDKEEEEDQQGADANDEGVDEGDDEEDPDDDDVSLETFWFNQLVCRWCLYFFACLDLFLICSLFLNFLGLI